MIKNMKNQSKNRIVNLIRTKPILLLVGVLLLSVGLVVNARSWFAPRESVIPAPPQNQKKSVVITQQGFAPAQMESQQPIDLVIDNGSVVSEMSVSVKDEGGQLVREVQIGRNMQSEAIQLQSGRYTLSEANHPEWVCHITVQ